jgi:hypothetical protein
LYHYKSQILSSPTGITATALIQQVSCNGLTDGSITINSVTNGSGNYEYSSNGTTFQASSTFAGLGKGNYIITVKDKTTNCVTTVNAQISEPALLPLHSFLKQM